MAGRSLPLLALAALPLSVVVSSQDCDFDPVTQTVGDLAVTAEGSEVELELGNLRKGAGELPQKTDTSGLFLKSAPTVHRAQEKNKEDIKGKEFFCEVALILQLKLEPWSLFWYHTKMNLLPDVW